MINSAIEEAVKAHIGQLRRGTDIPYITHPLAVGIMLAKAGCSDNVIIAGILHDTVEDTSITLDYIRDTFGDQVAIIVEGASEPDRALPWKDRKTHTIEFLKTASLEVRLVTCADKLNNIRAIDSDHKKIGDKIWDRFNRGKEDQEWYYRGLVNVLCHRSDNRDHGQLFRQLKNKMEEVFCGGVPDGLG